MRSRLSLLFSRLNSSSTLRLSSYVRCSGPSTLTALGWTLSSKSTSFLYWGVQNWTQHSRYGLPVLSRGERSPLSTCWQYFVKCSQGYHQPSLSQGHTAGSCSAWCPSGPPDPLLPNCSPAGWSPVYTGACGSSQVQDFALLLGLHEVPVRPSCLLNNVFFYFLNRIPRCPTECIAM